MFLHYGYKFLLYVVCGCKISSILMRSFICKAQIICKIWNERETKYENDASALPVKE